MKHRTCAAFVFGAALLAGCSQGPSSNASTININDEGKFTSDSTIAVTGQVEGTDSVSRVGCAVAGNEQAATLAAAGGREFSCSLSLKEGINTITVAAYNAQGSAATSQLTVMKVSNIIVKGSVTNDSGAGGNPVNGAQIQVRIGGKTQSLTTGPTGEFSVPFKDIGRASSFTLNVSPPFGSFLSARTYEGIPLDAYSSALGGANDIQVVLANASGGQLPITPAHYSNFVGTLREGETVRKSSNLLGRRVADEKGRRTCLSSTVSAPCLNDPPQFGEDGLVVVNGQFTAVTDKNGKYLIPRRTIFNTYATSLAMWAGDYNGTDTGNPQTALEFFWSKFALLKVANVFYGIDPANPPANTNDLALEPFDPASNPRIASIPVAHDTLALEGFNFSGEGANAVSYSIPKFSPTISTGIAFELGQYVDFTSGAHNLRVFKIANGVQSQQITITNQALNLTTGANSTVTTWRDGTNLTQAVNAKFLAIPTTQSPVIGATGVSITPNLSWRAVPGAKSYTVYVVDAKTGSLVWLADTRRTQIDLPFSLSPDTQYVWGVNTDDQFTLSDNFGTSPAAFAASHWVDTNHIFKLRGKGYGTDAMNTWRGKLAANYLERNGFLPSIGIGTDSRFRQNLISRGYRASSSESASFTTGK
jgi:hypothetical protein